MLSALDHAHSKGIVHRDLKPDNILLRREEDGEEVVKVLDFGIAKLVREGKDSLKTLTQAGHVLGTPHYMSPEQISGDEVSAAADLYSIGIMLYEMLVGQHPFHGSTSTAVMVAHLRDDPPPLPGALEHSKWGEAVNAALVKQPHDRIPSASALLDIISRSENIEELTQRWEAPPVSIDLDGHASRDLHPEIDGSEDSNTSLWSGPSTPKESEAPPASKADSPSSRPIALVALVLLTLIVGVAASIWFLTDEKKDAHAEAHASSPETPLEPPVALEEEPPSPQEEVAETSASHTRISPQAGHGERSE